MKVYKEKKKNYTFDDLVDQRIAAMYRVYNQFFHVNVVAMALGGTVYFWGLFVHTWKN